jgi:hypothetical protein
MRRLARDVAAQIGFADWRDDLVTREIGSAPDLRIALERLSSIIHDASTGLRLLLAELPRRSSRPN